MLYYTHKNYDDGKERVKIRALSDDSMRRKNRIYCLLRKHILTVYNRSLKIFASVVKM